MEKPAEMERLAELAVRFGVNVQPDQELLVFAPIEAVDFVREITVAAYKAGAKLVLPFYSDEKATLARYAHAPDGSFDYAPGWLFSAMGDALLSGAARLSVYAETPGLLAEQDPDKVARANAAQADAYRPVMAAIGSNAVNWNIVPFVTEGWATRVFPHLPAAKAVAELWRLVYAATRVDRPDPVAAWRENFAELTRRMTALQQMNLDALRFHGGQTDLTVGLARGHKWVGGGITANNGVLCAPNLPTEEIFTMPDRRRAEGRAHYSKPVAVGGSLVEGLVVEFRDGCVVDVQADKGTEVIRRFLETDEGAGRLGEVALVAHSSPISQSNVLYFNTLFDENAASHLAFGRSYAMNLLPGTDPTEAGANDSKIHLDCMVGTAEMAVDGLAEDGTQVPIMRQGEFVI